MARMSMLAGLRGRPLDDEDDLEQAEGEELEAEEEAPKLPDPAVELAAAREAVGEAWFAGGASLAEAIRRKVTALEAALVTSTRHEPQRRMAVDHLRSRLARARRPGERRALEVMLDLLGGS